MKLLPLPDLITASVLGMLAGLVRMLLFLNTGRNLEYRVCTRWKWLAQISTSIFVAIVILHWVEYKLEDKNIGVPLLMIGSFCSTEFVDLLKLALLDRLKDFLGNRRKGSRNE